MNKRYAFEFDISDLKSQDASAATGGTQNESIILEKTKNTTSEIEQKANLVINAVDPGLTIFRYGQSLATHFLDPKLAAQLVQTGSAPVAMAAILTAFVYSSVQAGNVDAAEDPVEKLQETLKNKLSESRESVEKMQEDLNNIYEKNSKLKEKYAKITLEKSSPGKMRLILHEKSTPDSENSQEGTAKSLRFLNWLRQTAKDTFTFLADSFEGVTGAIFTAALFYWLSWGLFGIILQNSTAFVIPGNLTISTLLALIIPFSYLAVLCSKKIFIWIEQRFDFTDSTFWKKNIKPFFGNTSWKETRESLGLKILAWPLVMIAMPFIAIGAQVGSLFGLVSKANHEKKTKEAAAREALIEISSELLELQKNAGAKADAKADTTELAEQEKREQAPENTKKLTGWFMPPEKATAVETTRFFWLTFVDRFAGFEYIMWFGLVVLVYARLISTNSANLFFEKMLYASIPILAISFVYAVYKTMQFWQEKSDFAKEKSGPDIYVLEKFDSGSFSKEYHDSYVVLMTRGTANLYYIDSSGEFELFNDTTKLTEKRDLLLEIAQFTKNLPIQKQTIDIQQQILPLVWNQIYLNKKKATPTLFFQQLHLQNMADRTEEQESAPQQEENKMVAFFKNPFWTAFAFVGLFFINAMFIGRLFFLEGTGISTFLLQAPITFLLGNLWTPAVTVFAIVAYTIFHGFITLDEKNRTTQDANKKEQYTSSKPSQKSDSLDSATKENRRIKFLYVLGGLSLTVACSIFALSSVPAFAALLSPAIILGMSAAMVMVAMSLSALIWFKSQILSSREKNITYFLLAGLIYSLIPLASLLIPFVSNNLTISTLLSPIASINILYLAAPLFLMAAILFTTTFTKEDRDVERAQGFLKEKLTDIETTLSVDKEYSLLLKGEKKERVMHAISLLLLALNPKSLVQGEKKNYTTLKHFLQKLENEAPIRQEERTKIWGLMSKYNEYIPASTKIVDTKNKQQFLETVSFIFLIVLACLIVYLPSALSAPVGLRWLGFSIIALCTIPRILAERFLDENNKFRSFIAQTFSIRTLTALVLGLVSIALLIGGFILPMVALLGGYTTIPVWLLASTAVGSLFLMQATLTSLSQILGLFEGSPSAEKIASWISGMSDVFLLLDVVALVAVAIAPLFVAVVALMGIFTLPATVGLITILATLPVWFLIFKMLLPKVLTALMADENGAIEKETKENIENNCKHMGYVLFLVTALILVSSTGFSLPIFAACLVSGLGLAVSTYYPDIFGRVVGSGVSFVELDGESSSPDEIFVPGSISTPNSLLSHANSFSISRSEIDGVVSLQNDDETEGKGPPHDAVV